MNCPRDNTPLRQAGYTHACDACGGAWVVDEVLVPLLEERANALIELEWKPRHADEIRACPACASPMQTVALGSVALDRCPPHGVWFDAGELAAALKEAKHFRAEPAHPAKTHESLLHKLGKLLSVD
ncbi:MAG: zf-TFIIB domain-containing protein [Deltaproteobacteria bacterium]|nr:zf-TFIIB domain-containing protein [Deltaproteobacteria bacterium]